MIVLRLGTIDGVTTLQNEGGQWTILGRSLIHHDVNVLVHHPRDSATLFAGTYGQGLFRTQTGGVHWDRLPLDADYIRALAFDPADPRTIYAGTEPANLYRSTDGGDSWIDLQIRRLPGADQWSLPYSPRSGALRTLALHPDSHGLIIGGVEQGGIITSTDRGHSWSINNRDLHPDVHTVALHPLEPAICFAATGEGTYVTRDHGRTWTRLFSDYTRAIALHPHTPELLLAGPAREVGEGGRILVSRDGGHEWEPAENGVPVPLPDMVEHFIMHPAMPETAFAVLSEGGLLISQLPTIEWHPLVPDIRAVQTIDLTITTST